MMRVFHRIACACPAVCWAVLLFVVTISLGSCAQILTPVPPKAPADPQDYSWTKPALSTGIDFYVVRQNTGTLHTLTASDGVHVHDNTDSAGFLLRSGSETVVLDSIEKNSIFSLPAGFSFSPTSTASTRMLGINAVMSSGSAVFVGTDKGLYRSTDQSVWTKVLPGRVTALAQDSQKTMYTSVGNSISSSSNNGNSWSTTTTSHSGATITALACREDGRLYIGYDGGLGVEYTVLAGSFSQFQRLSGQFKAIQSIAVQVIGSITVEIVADSGSVTVFHNQNSVGSSVVLGVDCLLLDDTGGSYAGSRTQGLFVEPLFQSTYNAVFATAQNKITGLTVNSLPDTNGNHIYAVSFNGSILRNDTNKWKPIGGLLPPARNVACASNGDLLIGTDSGLWVVTTSGSLRTITGPVDTIVANPASGLALLDRTGLQSSSIEASWFGGTLVGPGLPTGIPITARIQDHVDSLRVPNALDSSSSTTYGESFIIRYSPESVSAKIVSGFPLYWIVYYSKGIGPILIQEYMLDTDQKYTVQGKATMIRKR